MKDAKCLYAACLSVALLSWPGRAQNGPAVVVKIDIENIVSYLEDTADVSKLATDSGMTTPAVGRTFEKIVTLGDIVAVNGVPVRGTLILNPRSLNMRPNAAPGAAIGDATRSNTCGGSFEILWPDGTPIGTIMVADMGGGSAPPGSPIGATQANFALIGGSGAFIGVRGHGGAAVATAPIRQASMTEDPANRRINGGGKMSFFFQLLPEERPQVIVLASGPAIVHSSNSEQVSAANPAHPGETLTLYATGLGPVRAAIDPGQPFPASPLAVVNSPVEVRVNGTVANVLYAGGYPGAVDAFQVNFTLPPSLVAGTADLQVSAAWIPGNTVKVPVQ
jgi:hypothetical protein